MKWIKQISENDDLIILVGAILAIFVGCCALLYANSADAAMRQHPEVYYQDQFCTPAISITNTTHNQYRFSDGKIADCVTKYGVVFEIDFANKGWTEAVGQSLHYAQQATRDIGRPFVPGIAVIVESSNDCDDLVTLYSENVSAAIVEIGNYAYQCAKQ